METSHQPTSRGLPRPIRGLLVNQAPRTQTIGHSPPEWKQVSPQANMRNQNTYKGSINETLADLTYIEVTRS
ncbi:hypothetical protein EFE07_10100 [Corynebacterium diphtheriae]|nr:hypothetical protein EFE07_10100 [Corynebacterium diphtheriae]